MGVIITYGDLPSYSANSTVSVFNASATLRVPPLLLDQYTIRGRFKVSPNRLGRRLALACMSAALPCRPPFVLCTYVVNPSTVFLLDSVPAVLRLALVPVLPFYVLYVGSSA